MVKSKVWLGMFGLGCSHSISFVTVVSNLLSLGFIIVDLHWTSEIVRIGYMYLSPHIYFVLMFGTESMFLFIRGEKEKKTISFHICSLRRSV